MTAAPIAITVDGRTLETREGTTVAAALLNAGIPIRTSVTGEPRTALCAMGICHECRVTVDGHPHQRACMVFVAPDMRVDRDA